MGLAQNLILTWSATLMPGPRQAETIPLALGRYWEIQMLLSLPADSPSEMQAATR